MSIFRFSNAGGFGTYQRYNDFLAGNPTTPVITDFGSMFPLGVFTLSSAQATVEFTNIPQTYTHLQVRVLARQAGSWAEGSFLSIRMNGDSNNNYASHALRGVGTNPPSSGASTSANQIFVNRVTNGSQGTSTFGTAVIDILDYRNTNKFKTVRALAGFDNNGSGEIAFNSGLWQSGSAITSIRFGTDTGDFVANTSFALYGVL